MKNSRIFNFVCILFAMLGCAAVSHAQNGAQLAADCRVAVKVADGEPLQASEVGHGYYCVGLIAGIRYTHDLWSYSNTQHHISNSNKENICVPANISNGQMAKIVLKYLDDHPEHLHEDAPFVATMALLQVYSCRVTH